MTAAPSLFAPVALGTITLSNRLVMAPMTRSRAPGNVPNLLMAEYYAQRAGAGLVVPEGTSPSPNGLGYLRIPGLYSTAQVTGWTGVTAAVHAKGGHFFSQLMHTGRFGHPLNLPEGAEVVSPSAIAEPGEMFTDQKGLQPHPVPRALTESDLGRVRDEYVLASTNAMAAGFDTPPTGTSLSSSSARSRTSETTPTVAPLRTALASFSRSCTPWRTRFAVPESVFVFLRTA